MSDWKEPDSVHPMLDDLRHLDYKVHWLLKNYDLYSEDGYYCFPDGEIWQRDNYDG